MGPKHHHYFPQQNDGWSRLTIATLMVTSDSSSTPMVNGDQLIIAGSSLQTIIISGKLWLISCHIKSYHDQSGLYQLLFFKVMIDSLIYVQPWLVLANCWCGYDSWWWLAAIRSALAFASRFPERMVRTESGCGTVATCWAAMIKIGPWLIVNNN